MGSSYQSQRKMILDIFEKNIIPQMQSKNKDADYDTTIAMITSEFGVAPSLVEDIIKNLILTGKLKQIRRLEPSTDYKKIEEEFDNKLKDTGVNISDGIKDTKDVQSGQ